MIGIFRDLLDPRYPYPTEASRQRAANLLLISYLLMAFQIGVILLGLSQQIVYEPLFQVGNFLALGVLVAQIGLIRSGRLTLAIWVFIGVTLLMMAPPALQVGINSNFLLVVIPLVAAGVLLNRRGVLLVLVIVIALLLVRFSSQMQLTTSQRLSPAELFQEGAPAVLITFGATVLLLLIFSGSTERIARAGAEDIRQLRAISAFNADPGSYTRLSGRENEALKVMQNGLRLLETDLGYPIAQIYLASGGQITRRVRQDSVYNAGSFVLTESEARFVRDALVLSTPGPLMIDAADSLEAARFLTPPARLAALFPLRDEGRTIGVLEVQSLSITGFSPNKIESLRTLANTLSIAEYLDENFTALQTTLADQQQLLSRVRSQLSDAQQRGERMITEGWQRFLEGRGGERAVGYDIGVPGSDGAALQSLRPVPASDLPPAIRDVLQRGEIVVEHEADDQIVKAPITLRGEVLGAMSFRIPGDNPISDRQMEMVRTITNRLAAALENNRLFEQSQSQAQRERKANEIASELLTATNVETLMSLAAERFNEALGAVYTRVTLQPGALADPPLPAASNGNGHHEIGTNGGAAAPGPG